MPDYTPERIWYVCKCRMWHNGTRCWPESEWTVTYWAKVDKTCQTCGRAAVEFTPPSTELIAFLAQNQRVAEGG